MALLAIGHNNGSISLLHSPASLKSPTSTHHWHAHTVRSITFTPTQMRTGGEEGVLVSWGLKTGTKEFMARLGGIESVGANDQWVVIGGVGSLITVIAVADTNNKRR